jgi:competence protein ComEC
MALGAGAALRWHWCFLALFLLLWLPQLNLKRVLIHLAVALTTFAYAHHLYPEQQIPQGKIKGVAHLSISSISRTASPFHRSYLYKGTIESFQTEDGRHFSNLPCRIFLPEKKERPSADCSYTLEGTLSQKGDWNFHFKPTKKVAWKKIADTFSLAEWRFELKEKVRSYLKRGMGSNRACSFLTALFTGDLDERSLSVEFSHLGLQHILAISGFHFAILAAFLGLLLRLIFPYKIALIGLILLLTCYFIFLGSGPSVQRGWIAILIYLVSRLCNFQCSALNALGLGMILALAIDPLHIAGLGFQLSFLATGAILIAYPTVNRWLTPLLPKRPLSVVAEMNRLNQHGYLLSSFVRESLALTLTVHLFTLPVLLFTFHKFPLLSLVYNLFFPFWTSIVFLIFLCSLLLPFLFPVATTLTTHLLNLTSHPPVLLDTTLYTPTFPLELTLLATTALLCTAILLSQKSEVRIQK